MPPEISERARNLGTEKAFVVSAEVAALERQGFEIIKLHIGEPSDITPQNIRDEAKRRIDEGKTGYTPSAGILDLRKAISKYFLNTKGININPDSIVVDCGSKSFIGASVFIATDGGKGEVLYPNPGYPVYEAMINALGATGDSYTLREKNDFRVDINELKSKVNKNTKLLILNDPQNPTGSRLTRDDVKQIADVVLSHGNMFVLADEIYSRIIYGGDFVSIGSIPEMLERTIIMDGFSKTYAMTGWRLGFAGIENKPVVEALTKWVTDNTACATHFVQYAGIEALNGPQDEAKRMLEKYRQNRDLIVKGFNDIEGFTCKTPGGAFYAYPNATKACKKLGLVAETLRKVLLNEAHVSVTADIHFGPKVDGLDYIRGSYAGSPDVIKEGLSRIKNYVEGHSR